MKNLKLILITAIMFFASIGFSFTESTKANSELSQDINCIKIYVLNAHEVPGLTQIIRQNVSPNFLILQSPKLYSFTVKSHGDEYTVFGNFKDWKIFFFGYPDIIGGH